MTWLSWLPHCIIFQIRKGIKLTNQKFMLSFVGLFSFSTNQETMLYAKPRTSSRTPPLVHSVEQKREQEEFVELDDFDDCIEEQGMVWNET